MTTVTKADEEPTIERLHGRIYELERARLEDRVTLSEQFGDIKVRMSSFDSRVGVVENGVKTLMTHSTWVLRLVLGGVGVAVVRFILDSGLNAG